MAFKGLTINTAAEAAGHIYAEDDASIYQSIFGSDGVLNIGNCLKATVISNNKVRISDGVLCVGGHIGRIKYSDYQDIAIENGASGYKRNDIIYARFLTSGSVDTFTLIVKKGTATTGTAADPATTAGNLYQGATERDYPLYRVKLSGLNISSVEQLFTVIPTVPQLKSQLAQQDASIKQLNEGLSDVVHTGSMSGIKGRLQTSQDVTLKVNAGLTNKVIWNISGFAGCTFLGAVATIKAVELSWDTQVTLMVSYESNGDITLRVKSDKAQTLIIHVVAEFNKTVAV